MHNLLLSNFTYIREHLVQWSLQGYETALGAIFYVLIFTAIIGYVYLKQQSAVAAVIVILILITAFSTFISQLSPFTPWVNMMLILSAIVITGLILIFYIRKRGGI